MKKPFAFLLLAIVFCFLAAGTGFSESNQNKEPEENFSPGFYYTIQKGDTLWELSKKFYDSGLVWPALWSQNTEIKNPHLIYPGKRIRLYQKTDILPPEQLPETVQKKIEEEKRLSEASNEKDPSQESLSTGEESSSTEQQPSPTEQKASPVTPPEDNVYYFIEAISRAGFLKKYPSGSIDAATDPLKMGIVFEVGGNDNRVMISQGDTIYIKPAENASLIIGSRYFIYKPPQKITDKVTGGYAGHHYRIAGIAEVTNVQPSYAVADVIKSYITVRVGDFIMPWQKRSPKIPLTPSPEGVTGRIITNDEHTRMSNDHSIVFLNKGEEDGVQPGQRYYLYTQGEGKVDGEKILFPPEILGRLLVLLVQDQTATAIITNSRNVIPAGTTFGNPTS